jgi:hypothetical protein
VTRTVARIRDFASTTATADAGLPGPSEIARFARVDDWQFRLLKWTPGGYTFLPRDARSAAPARPSAPAHDRHSPDHPSRWHCCRS